MKEKSFGPVSEPYVVMCAQADAVNEKESPPALNLKRKCWNKAKKKLNKVNLVFKCVYGCLCVSFYTLDLLVP